MSYNIDLNSISTESFYEYLKTRRLFPSHQILKMDIDKYLKLFFGLGYTDIGTLYNQIGNEKRCKFFAAEHKIDIEYLIILRRHIASFLVKPRLLSEFSLLDETIIGLLSENNIRNSKDLYERFNDILIPEKYVDYLFSIKELTRLRYVAGKFTDGLFLSGYQTIEMIAKAKPEVLNNEINETMIKYNISKVVLGLEDTKFLINDAILFMKWVKN